MAADRIDTLFSIEAQATVDAAISNLDRLMDKVREFEGRERIKITPTIDGTQAVRAARGVREKVEQEIKAKPVSITIKDDGKGLNAIVAKLREIVAEQLKVREIGDRPITTTVRISSPDVKQLIADLNKVEGLTRELEGANVRLSGSVLRARTPAELQAERDRDARAAQRAADEAARASDRQARAQTRAQEAYRKTQLAHDQWQRRTISGMATMESNLNRFVNRIQFLVAAYGAGLVFDLFGKSTEEFIHAEAAVRGLEITATRFGVNGSGMLKELRDDTIGFRHELLQSADALNKLLIGGIAPKPGEVGQLKQMAVGASNLFGTDPSKNIEDIGTGILRLSPRILDNLGLIVRAKDAYEEYGRIIGKDAKELTGAEKVQAFWNKTMHNSGTEALLAAGKLKTPFVVLEQAKTTVADLKLAFGEVTSAGIMPFVHGMQELDHTMALGIARFTTFAGTTALVSTGLIQGGSGLIALGQKVRQVYQDTKALAVVQRELGMLQAFPTSSPFLAAMPGAMVARDNRMAALQGQATTLEQQGALNASQLRATAVGAGLVVVVAALTAAYQGYSMQLAEINRKQLDAVQSQIQFQSFLESVNLRLKTNNQETEKFFGNLGSASGSTRGAILPDVNATLEYIKSLETMIDKTGLSKEQTDQLKLSVRNLITEGLDDFVTHAEKADAMNGRMGLSAKTLAGIYDKEVTPGIINAYQQIAQAQAKSLDEQRERLFSFSGTSKQIWTDIGDSLLVVAALVVDTIVGLVKAGIGSIAVLIGAAEKGLGDFWQFASGKGFKTVVSSDTIGPLAPGEVYENKAQGDARKRLEWGMLQYKNLLGGSGAKNYGLGLADATIRAPYDAIDAARAELAKQIGPQAAREFNPPDVDGAGGKDKKKKKAKDLSSLTGKQQQIVNTVLAVADAMHIDERGKLAALETIIVESGIGNPAGGDHTSVGAFQQQKWWGTKAQRMDPAYAAKQFFRHYLGLEGNDHITDSMTAAQVAANIQRPREDLRWKYDGWRWKGKGSPTARELAEQILYGNSGQLRTQAKADMADYETLNKGYDIVLGNKRMHEAGLDTLADNKDNLDKALGELYINAVKAGTNMEAFANDPVWLQMKAAGEHLNAQQWYEDQVKLQEAIRKRAKEEEKAAEATAKHNKELYNSQQLDILDYYKLKRGWKDQAGQFSFQDENQQKGQRFAELVEDVKDMQARSRFIDPDSKGGIEFWKELEQSKVELQKLYQDVVGFVRPGSRGKLDAAYKTSYTSLDTLSKQFDPGPEKYAKIMSGADMLASSLVNLANVVNGVSVRLGGKSIGTTAGLAIGTAAAKRGQLSLMPPVSTSAPTVSDSVSNVSGGSGGAGTPLYVTDGTTDYNYCPECSSHQGTIIGPHDPARFPNGVSATAGGPGELSGNDFTPQPGPKQPKPKTEKGYDFEKEFGDMIFQVLSTSSSLKELGMNAEKAGATLLANFAKQSIGGIGGDLVGGLIAFGANMLFAKENPIPVQDNAVLSRIVNFSDLSVQLNEVRQKSELKFSARREELWNQAARAAA